MTHVGCRASACIAKRTERSRSVDRVQFTAPDRERHIANRELGPSSGSTAGDSCRSVSILAGPCVLAKDHHHLDYGYAVTSHSSQGQTADRVLVHIDTDRAGEQLVNRRLAYVALSRGRHDAQIYTNDASRLADTLSREISHRAALTLDASLGPVVAPASQSHRAVVTQGLGIER